MSDADSIPTASWVRRFVALFIDWVASSFVAVAFVGYWEAGSPLGFVPLAVYVLESALFTWLMGGSFGKLCVRLRVVPVQGPIRPLNPLKLIARQILVVLVIPPLVFSPNGRGLHDMFAGTATVSRDEYHRRLGTAAAN